MDQRPVAVQGTGHNAGPLGPLDDTVLLRTDALRGVRIAAATLDRLRAVKSAYDPRDLLRADHPVPRAP